MLILCQEILDSIVAQAIREYPHEACGFLAGEKGQNSVTDFIPCKNVYDEMHARDPVAYPRNSRTAYLIDPRLQQGIFDSASRHGVEIKAVYHSHTDHDAYFSEEDRLVAAPWGEPMLPGISYLVVSIWDRKLKEIHLYEWDEENKDFRGNKL